MIDLGVGRFCFAVDAEPQAEPYGSRAAGELDLLGLQVDPLAQRTLIKGEALPVLAGRADDYRWPRREVGPLDASTVPTASAAPEPAPGKGQGGQQAAVPQQQQQLLLQKKRPVLVPQNPNAGGGPGFFSFFRRPLQQPQVQPPPVAPRPGPVRPPGYINRAASVPPSTIAR
jgi:hypothetical protein